MEGLPFLPGNTFTDPTKTKYHVSQTLGYKNGHILTKRPEVGIGGDPIVYNQLSDKDLDDLANFKPTLTYGQARQAPPHDFIPAHVAWDKKVLRFFAYLKQTVHESPVEFYRVRLVHIYYYLEDDSISVIEPHVDNSGMPQGTFLCRQRVPKNDRGDNWHWTDLNNGENITLYGKVFRLCDCDKFTKDFLESEGIVLNPPEEIPKDPYIDRRHKLEALKKFITPSSFDELKQFLEMDRKVLRFYVVWDEREKPNGELRPFILHFYLSDDTLEIREVPERNSGRDPFPILIGRHKVPVDRDDIRPTHQNISMELTRHEVKRYFLPSDFKIGNTVRIYGRRFLIYDCDNFTKAFYYKNFGMTDFTPLDVQIKKPDLAKSNIPEYKGYGSPEDTLQSCVSIQPKPPKKDEVKIMENESKVLRYEAILDSPKLIDKTRRFIIYYYLSNDMIMIYEPHVKNSGIIGGKFLEKTRVAKRNSTAENPVYYGAQDLYIGAKIDIFSHCFIITNADVYVLKYMEAHKNQFPEHVLCSFREILGPDLNKTEIKEKREEIQKRTEPAQKSQRTEEELYRMVSQVQTELKKLSITDKTRIDDMFLRYEQKRKGFISDDDVRNICNRFQLHIDDEVLHGLVDRITSEDPEGRGVTLSDPEGKISLEQFRKFIEYQP